MLPPYYSTPTEPRDVALARQRRVIAEFYRSVTGPAAARAELARRRGAIDPTLLPWRKGRETMRIQAEIRAEFGEHDLEAPGRRLFLTGAQGSGKSRANAEEIAAIRSALAVWWLVPTLGKAKEQAEDYRKNHMMEGSLQPYVVRGRSALDDARKPMCDRASVAEKAAAAGVSVGETICPTCPFREACGYMKQAADIASMGGKGVFFGSHQYAFLPGCPAPAPHLVVIDESVASIAGSSRIIIDPADFVSVAGYPIRNLDWFGGVTDYVGFRRTLLGVAEVMTTRPDSLAAIREMGITAEHLKQVCYVLDTNEKMDAEEAVKSFDGDAELEQRLDDLERRNTRKVTGLLRLIRAELEQPRDHFNAIRFEPNYPIRSGNRTVKVPRLLGFPGRKIELAAEVPILHLDGTGDHWLAERIFGSGVEHVHVPVERAAHVTGTTGKNYSRQSILGMDAHRRPHRPAEAMRLQGEILEVMARMPGETFLAAGKSVVEHLQDRRGLDRDRSGWFGALRGMNAWEDHESAIVVGREQPPVRDIEDATRAFLADDPEPLFPAIGYVPQTRGRRMRDGSVQVVEVDVHPDPHVQTVMEQIREAEIAQAVDRVRAIFNWRTLILLNELVLDITYDKILRHAELVSGGARWERALADKGVLPLKPADMHRLFPNLWESEKGAQHDLERVITPKTVELGVITPKTQIIDSSLDLGGNNSLVHVSYRVAGQRGPRPSRALIDIRRHPDPAVALSAILGVEVRVIDAPTKTARPSVHPVPQPIVPTEPLRPVMTTQPVREGWSGWWWEDEDPLSLMEA